MRQIVFASMVGLGVVYCLGEAAHGGLVAQWLADDLSARLSDGDAVNEWAESITGATVLEPDLNPPLFRTGATPAGSAAVEFNGDDFDNDEAIQTVDRSGSPVAGLTEFTVAVTFRPRVEGENPFATDFWRNTAVVDADIAGINIDWGTSWRGTDSFAGGVGQPPNDISVYAQVEGQDDLLGQWLTGVYTVNGAEQTHMTLLMAEDGNFGVTPDDGSRDLGVDIDPRGDFGFAFGVQRANAGGRNLLGDITEVRFYDETFDDNGVLAIAQEMYATHVSGAGVTPRLQAGDANQDLKFDQVDLVQVQVTAKYLTGAAATWGEGDWNGAPGGQQGSPPPGNGLFDQLDIVAALTAGVYLTGPYAALPAHPQGAGNATLVYYAGTGELSVEVPGTELTSINIDSAAAIFTGEPATNLGGSFDNDADNNIFKATFGSSFGSLSFGNVAQAGLSEEFVLGDLTVIGSLAGGGDLGVVDLKYIPEPSGLFLLGIGLMALTAVLRRVPLQRR